MDIGYILGLRPFDQALFLDPIPDKGEGVLGQLDRPSEQRVEAVGRTVGAFAS
jgi:hypothetical protein